MANVLGVATHLHDWARVRAFTCGGSGERVHPLSERIFKCRGCGEWFVSLYGADPLPTDRGLGTLRTHPF